MKSGLYGVRKGHENRFFILLFNTLMSTPGNAGRQQTNKEQNKNSIFMSFFEAILTGLHISTFLQNMSHIRGHFLDFYPSVRQQDGIVEPSEEYQWLHVTSLWGNVVWMFRHSLSFIIVTRGPKQIVSFYITIWFRIATINTLYKNSR